MALPVLILGESGSGKTASLRNFTADEVTVFNVAGKQLPFKKKLPMATTDNYEEIKAIMKRSSKKCFVIDDSQYLMAFDNIRNAKIKGYDKYTDMGLRFADLINFIIRELPDDNIVYLLHHPDTDQNGISRAKTVGKMIDNWLTLEGMFTIVLSCSVNAQREHKFYTQSNGQNTAKSPMDMFPYEMENDLKTVDTMIREYYEFDKENENEKA